MSQKEQINVFARTNFRNKDIAFGIKPDDRRRHVYIIGKTGMGKTTMIENMIVQDIQAGNGVTFVDPHGDSVEKVLNYIPSSRINDVVYFNPSDLDYPIAFNPLESVDPKYKHLVASGLMGVFTKMWANVWSARMEYILNNTILALLDTPGNTMLGIARMLVDKKFRSKIVDNIRDPVVKSFWVDEFANYNDKFRNEAIAPIQNKVGQFLSSALIRNIVGQPKSSIDLRELMDQKKMSGLGNIYANEILFEVGVHPEQKIGHLTTGRFQDLFIGIKRVLRRAIQKGGTTIRDFRSLNGTPGSFQQFLKVYGRAGRGCLRAGCSGTIRVIRPSKQAQPSFYCPRCQRKR